MDKKKPITVEAERETERYVCLISHELPTETGFKTYKAGLIYELESSADKTLFERSVEK